MISVSILQEKALRWQSIVPQLQQIKKPVIKIAPQEKLLSIDLSAANTALSALDVVDTAAIDQYIQEQVRQNSAIGAVGGYMENRLLYLRSQVFAGQEHRTLHIGVDVWLPAQTPIHAPIAAHVHSFANNNNFGDYGATIILAHEVNSIRFYTLYGHLSSASIQGLQEGMPIKAGQEFAYLGNESENGNWPPHLHFQLMLDMEGRKGDFPGVCAPSQKAYYQLLCPDANLLL